MKLHRLASILLRRGTYMYIYAHHLPLPPSLASSPSTSFTWDKLVNIIPVYYKIRRLRVRPETSCRGPWPQLLFGH